MIDKIKKDILINKNKFVKIKIKNIRNKSEYIEGIIMEVYDRLFLVKCTDGINRSFIYSDILTGNVEIRL